MGWYEEHAFNALLERALDRPEVHAERRGLLAEVDGDVLEIGLGTGLNLPHYPAEVRRLQALTRDAALDQRAIARAGSRALAIEHVRGDAQAVPLPDASVDAVVCTLVLCSVGDPEQALREIHRVLRPRGRLFLMEHVISGLGCERTVQRALTPLWRRLACGCRLDRDLEPLVRRVGFEWERVEQGASDAASFPARRLLRGVARSSR